MAIDFTFSPEQVATRQGARAFAAGVLKDVKKTIDKFTKPDERFYAIKPFYSKMVEAGFVKGLIPAEYGGTPFSTLNFALGAEELAAVDLNVPSAVLATGLGLQALIRFGNEEQKRRFLPDFVEDGISHVEMIRAPSV